MIQGSGPEESRGFVKVLAAGGGGTGLPVPVFLHEETPRKTINKINRKYFNICPSV
jgi:hypothetical protein